MFLSHVYVKLKLSDHFRGRLPVCPKERAPHYCSWHKSSTMPNSPGILVSSSSLSRKAAHARFLYHVTVLKYRKDTDLRFSEKIAKFGAHSAKKKLNRLTQKMVGVVVRAIFLCVCVSLSLSLFLSFFLSFLLSFCLSFLSFFLLVFLSFRVSSLSFFFLFFSLSLSLSRLDVFRALHWKQQN